MERQDVIAAVASTGNVPMGMEYFPAGDATPFDYIKKQIDSVDYYILIVAGKYGSTNKETGLSYTEMEFDYAVEKKVPIAVLQYKDLKTLTGDKLEMEDPKKRELLEKFRVARAKSSLDEAMRNMHKTLEQRDKTGKCRITEGSRVHILELFKFFDHELKENTTRLINKAQEVPKDFNELSEDVFKSRKGI
jgi:hypothetical protein